VAHARDISASLAQTKLRNLPGTYVEQDEMKYEKQTKKYRDFVIVEHFI
jgi:hypothetical protein